jgi:hypothetical protein
MKNADPMSYSEVMGLTTAHPFKNWMADNWERIAHKTLMEITLPGKGAAVALRQSKCVLQEL